jgi:hypothetical protein
LSNVFEITNLLKVPYLLNLSKIPYLNEVSLPINGSKTAEWSCQKNKLQNGEYIKIDRNSNLNCNVSSTKPWLPIVYASVKWDDNEIQVTPNNATNVNITKFSNVVLTALDPSDIIHSIGSYISLGILAFITGVSFLPSLINKFRKNVGQKHSDSINVQNLSKSEIMGVCASVIAGVLILLSILQAFKEKEQTEITLITATIVFPFAFAGITSLLDKEKVSMRLLGAGFLNLVISIALIAIMKL